MKIKKRKKEIEIKFVNEKESVPKRIMNYWNSKDILERVLFISLMSLIAAIYVLYKLGYSCY